MKNTFYHFFGLFYPNLCLSCSKNLPPKKRLFCIDCQFNLPKTSFHIEKENLFTERFWGRIPLHAGAALYYFTRKSKAQHLVHELKYNKKKQIGIRLGQLYAEQLKLAPLFSDINAIIPVPLHPKKEKERGYNQSDTFALGLSEGMEKPWLKSALLRKEMTITQTQKSRMERFDNVKNAFAVANPEKLKNKHILLVDDVLTTGATLEACAIKLLEVPGTKVSMATIAIAN